MMTETQSTEAKKSLVTVWCYTISLDGYGAGPEQSLEHPLGIGGEDLHQWIVATRSWRAMHGKEGGIGGVNDGYAEMGAREMGAWIIGRNMFGPDRGPWSDSDWKGWWGDNPPYHVPVYVLTHYARPPLEMEGGTTFYFITEGIHAALNLAREAAKGKDIRIGGGAETIRQYLSEGLIDTLHIAVTPAILGSGERIFSDVDLRGLGYTCVRFEPGEGVTHVVLQRDAIS